MIVRLQQIISVAWISLLGVTSFAQDVRNSTTVPKECAEVISKDTGRPVMFPPRNGLVYGISTKPVHFANDPIPVLLWIDNPTDKILSTLTCSDIEYFWYDAIDVFDSFGHRIPSKREMEAKQEGHFDGIFICGRNIAINVAPHSCKHTAFSAPANDLTRDLRSYYDLSPGRYFIVPAEKTSQHIPVERTVMNPKVGLEINIQPHP